MDIAGGIQEYLACKENALTHRSYHWYVWMLDVFEKWCKANGLTELSQLSAVQVQAFVGGNSKDSDNTRHHKAQVVKGFLLWCAVDEDLGVREKMVKRIEMPKVEQPEVETYSQADIQKLLLACEKTKYPLRNQAAILLLLDTGIRVAELAQDGTRLEEETGLLLRHVIFGGRNAESYIIVMGKGRKTRTVKFGQATRIALQKYLNRERSRTSEHPYFFLAAGNKPFSVRGIQQMLERLVKPANVPDVHAHKFRHTFAINQLMAGTSALVLMQLMGHETLESTKIYTRALTQMQARQASVSVVDEMKKASRKARGQPRKE